MRMQRSNEGKEPADLLAGVPLSILGVQGLNMRDIACVCRPLRVRSW